MLQIKDFSEFVSENAHSREISATTYSGSNPISANQYISFVLRSLGYISGADFEVSTARTLSDQLGITGGQYSSASGFTRGDVAMISYNALSAKLKGRDATLFEVLAAKTAAQNDPSSPDERHVHHYIEKTVPGSGHYEQVAVTKTVDDYEVRDVTTWGCRSCDFTVTGEYSDLERHQIGDRSDPDWEMPLCFASGCWFITTKQNVKVGSHEETTYENKWVEDTIRVCSACGQREP